MLVSVVFSVAGLLFLYFGVVTLRNDRRRVRNGQLADAEVVGMRESLRHERRGGLHHPVVRFRTADGREVEKATAIGGKPSAPRPGDRVRVIYQPGAGGDVVIDSFKGRGLHSVSVLSALGLATLAVGMFPMIPMPPRSSVVAGLVAEVCGGLAFLAVGVHTFYRDLRRVRHGRRVGAEVVDLSRRYSHGPQGSGGPVYRPIVRFRTEDGQEVVTPAGMWSRSRPIARPGDQVRIRYETGNPRNVAIDTIAGRDPVPGGIFALAGLGMLAYVIYHMAR